MRTLLALICLSATVHAAEPGAGWKKDDLVTFRHSTGTIIWIDEAKNEAEVGTSAGSTLVPLAELSPRIVSWGDITVGRQVLITSLHTVGTVGEIYADGTASVFMREGASLIALTDLSLPVGIKGDIAVGRLAWDTLLGDSGLVAMIFADGMVSLYTRNGLSLRRLTDLRP